MLKKLADVGLFIFMGLSIPVILFYLVVLYDKLSRPDYKNRSGESYLWTGSILFVVVVIDYFILKRLFSTNYEDDDNRK